MKLVSDSKSVANTDVQAGQALQLTVVNTSLLDSLKGVGTVLAF